MRICTRFEDLKSETLSKIENNDRELISTTIDLNIRIRELEVQHGSLRAAARVLKCDAAYLLRLRDGKKHNPSTAMLQKLGLKKVVVYVRIK